MWMPASLRLRLTLAIGLLGLVTAMGLSEAAGHLAARQAEADQRLMLAQAASDMAVRLAHDLDSRASHLLMVASLAPMHDPAVPAAQKQAVLEAAQRANPDLAWIGLTDLQGRVLAATGGLLAGRDAEQRHWFAKGLQGLHFADAHEAVMLARLLPPPANGQPLRLLDIATPVRDAQGRTVGVLAGHLSLGWAVEARRRMLTRLADQGLSLQLLNQQGQPLAGDGAADAGAGKRLLSVVVRDAAYERFPGLGWQVVASRDKAVALAPARRLARVILAVGVAATALFAGLLWVILGRTLQPLEAVSRSARRIQ